VSWTVIAVTAEVPNTPKAWKVLRSAWMPAPPPESLPAIVRATGGRTTASMLSLPSCFRATAFVEPVDDLREYDPTKSGFR
jgi:hypothetical protein